jgi:DNA-binding MarR family transcriptional regulator
MKAAASAVLPDTAELATRLRVGVWRIVRRLRSEGKADLTATLLAAMGTIERHGPMTVGQFAGHEQVRKPTATRTIAALVERGLVVRTPDPLDGRVSWLALSPQGRKTLARVRRRHDEFLARRIRALPPEDQQTLQRAADIFERLVEGPR